MIGGAQTQAVAAINEETFGTAIAVMAIAVMAFAGLAFYFAPTIMAWNKRKKHIGRVFVLNLLLAWTLIGWGVLVLWASRDASDRT